MLTNYPRNADGLKAYSKQKQLETAKNVDEAIKLLNKRKRLHQF
ncbi:hypothetical protein [Desulfosporosinus metallidurans]|uniref:Uncharacterized protein n=1 Tax=Desulfosporosinus metallidurans TaxID=1888891 RepID=A0A1Q8QH19_9FIRM|nr:hypothetical protein [Desulfosporosinus metallidurans]OLN26634.1 hypothetical protein DSOL_4916 [Desulfosporosinus metallidurans]